MKRLILTTTVATAALTGAAFAQNMIDSAGITADGSTVTIPSIMADQAGYVVIHAVEDGEAVVPASIGNAAIEAGENTDVTVETEYPLEAGESYVVMLHEETNDNDTYDFGEGSTDVDTPVTADGTAVTRTFEVASEDAAATGASSASSDDDSMESGSEGMDSGSDSMESGSSTDNPETMESGAADAATGNTPSSASQDAGNSSESSSTPSGGTVPGQTEQ